MSNLDKILQQKAHYGMQKGKEPNKLILTKTDYLNLTTDLIELYKNSEFYKEESLPKITIAGMEVVFKTNGDVEVK